MQSEVRDIIHSFIQAIFYSASSSPLLLRGAPDTARLLCRSSTPKRHWQLLVKDLPKVPTWRLERDSNPRPHITMSHNTSRRATCTCTCTFVIIGKLH